MSALTDLLDQIIASGEVDPRRIAGRVLAEASDEVLQAEVPRLLRHAAHQRLLAHRSANPLINGPRQAETHPARSLLVQANQEYATMMRTGVYVGPESGWKRLGDCTVFDLRTVARMHERLADAHQAIAGKYLALADTLHRSGGAVVRDIPEGQVRALAGAILKLAA